MGLTAPIIGGLSTTTGAPCTAMKPQYYGTYDFNVLQAPCNHNQSLERYQVYPQDLRTLQLVANPATFMRAPINGQAFVQVYISGNLVSSNDPTYGYTLVADPLHIQLSGTYMFYKIVFNKEVRIIRPLIEVSYITLQDYCLKCNGIGVLNDLSIATSGSLIRVVNTDKLVQRSLKFVLTSQCAFYPQFTCPIRGYIGRKFGINITDADIANAVTVALDNLQNVQVAQNTIQTLSPEETLKNVTNVIAVQDASDPTIIHVSASLISYTSVAVNTLAATQVDFSLKVSS
jgi:hypothetical protein